MLRQISSKVVLLALVISAAACADESSVKKELAAKFPDMPVASVKKSPVKGLYEVVAGQDVFYVDEKVEHVVLGNIIETKSRRNLTAARREALMQVKFDSLPLGDAIKIVKGAGARKLAVFADPDCPFCRRLEADLAKVDNVTVYVFLLPLDQLHPEAAEKSRKVWCAPDRVKAWLDVMTTGALPDNKGDCATPVARIADLAQKLHIQGTPAMVFESGRLIPGAIPQAKIEELLNETKPASGKAAE